MATIKTSKTLVIVNSIKNVENSNVKCGCCLHSINYAEHFNNAIKQGLEGYSRDPGFDQNTVRDSGKRKIS